MGAFYDSGISAFTSFNDKYENVVLSALTWRSELCQRCAGDGESRL